MQLEEEDWNGKEGHDRRRAEDLGWSCREMPEVIDGELRFDVTGRGQGELVGH